MLILESFWYWEKVLCALRASSQRFHLQCTWLLHIHSPSSMPLYFGQLFISIIGPCCKPSPKVETPYHDNDLILTPTISPQSG
jgi:hypothetical protein